MRNEMTAFKLQSIRTRDVGIVYPMAAQIITPGAGPLCLHRSKSGNKNFPQRFQTRIRVSEYCTQNRNSFEINIFWHSCIQFSHSALQVAISFYAALSAEAAVMVPCHKLQLSALYQNRRSARTDTGRAIKMRFFWLMVRYGVIVILQGRPQDYVYFLGR